MVFSSCNNIKWVQRVWQDKKAEKSHGGSQWGERPWKRKSCYCRQQVPPAFSATPWKTGASKPCAPAVPAAQIISQTQNKGQNLILEELENETQLKLDCRRHPSCTSNLGAYQCHTAAHPGCSTSLFALCPNRCPPSVQAQSFPQHCWGWAAAGWMTGLQEWAHTPWGHELLPTLCNPK